MDETTPDFGGKIPGPVRFLLAFLRLRTWTVVVILGSVFLAVACSVGSNYAVKHLIDVVTLPVAQARDDVWMAFALLAGVIAADNLLWRVAGWIAADTLPRVAAEMRAALFRHVAGHSQSWFANRGAGVLASRVSAVGNAGFTLMQNFMWNTMPPAVAVAFAIILLSTVDGVMASVLGALALLLGVLIAWLARRGGNRHLGFAAEAASVDGQLVDVLQNISLVRAFSAFRRERNRFGQALTREVISRKSSLRSLETLRLVHAVATGLLTAGLLAWAVELWLHGRASTGDIVLICTLGFTILHASRDLAVALVDLLQYVTRMQEALNTLLAPHDLDDAENAGQLKAQGGEITFRNLTFAHPNQPPVLHHFNLEIRPGQSVGLVGPSGAGKSTVLALLQRQIVPQAGAVLIDGQDIGAMTQESLADTIAVVPQDVSLFHRSLRENLLYGRPDASDAELVAAAEAAKCKEFIERLPQGFDTVVGDRGTQLSGGQRQRIAIARALLKDAPILLLDEATSALDSASEAAVQAALDRLMEGRTVVAVAHRLATLSGFDRIVVLEAGRIVQDGSPTELAHAPGLYAELLRQQAEVLKVQAA